ncbi:MAG: hypothetical protein LUG52_01190 [Clostridia bacterium]|nr:hypothetical protein [Clostridia bacterium]
MQDKIIKSISYSQEEILQWILQLYVPKGYFEADPTYSKGIFYKSGKVQRPKYCFDIFPQTEGVIRADCRSLPLADKSVCSMVIDLPFLAASGASLSENTGNIINRRFGVCSNETELAQLYEDALREAWRVLKQNGILVMKCQDKVSSGKQYMMHCDIYTMAKKAGFRPADLFILLAKSRLIANWQRNQKHARKYHSYFWVFKKTKKGGASYGRKRKKTDADSVEST